MNSIGLLFFINVASKLALTETGNQYFISEPSNLTILAGSSVTLPCEVGGRQGACQWTRDGLGLGVDHELASYPRFSMSGCDIHISPLLPSDEGEYQCQVLAVPGVAPIKSRSAFLKVVVEPGQPHIIQATTADVITAREGQEVSLECHSGGAKPPAEITWIDGSGAAIEDGVETKIFPMEDGKTFKSISTVKFTPQVDTKITCSAHSSVFPRPKTSVILIKRLQKPKVYLSVGSPKILVGDSVIITCNNKAYPESVRYNWYVNGQRLVGEKSSNLRINNISKSAHGTRIKCKATNRIGPGESEIILDVRYEPVITKHPQDFMAKTGEEVSFTCFAESNPPPSYVWLKKMTSEVVGFGPKLNITAGKSDEEFVCKVFSEGFQEVESNIASLQIIRRPRIISVDEGELDGKYMLHCNVESVAKTSRISWIANDTPIDISDDNYETIFNEDGIFYHSFLVFKQEEKKNEDLACFVSNEAGTDYRAYNATGASDNSVVIPLLIIFLLILSILIISMFFFHNRQKQLSAEKMEKEKQLQNEAAESKPCLEKSIILDNICINTSQRFQTSNSSNNVLGRSFSLDQSRTGRRMGF